MLGLAVAAAAAVVAGVVVQRAPNTHPQLASPRYATDSFDYRPGAIGTAAGFPALGYRVPDLSDVSASSARDAWVVGSVAWHWDGRRWQSVSLPALAPEWSLSSVAAVAADRAWAVGSSNGPMDELASTRPLVEQWDGERWQVVPVPMKAPGAFDAVSADAPDDVWAVGWWLPNGTSRRRADAATRPLIAHWDGHTWTITRLAGRRSDSLEQVVAVTSTDVWVAGPGLSMEGRPTVRHWDGAGWSAIRAPFGPHDPAFVLAATSPTDAWAVGGILVRGHVKPISAHWDGHTWMIASTPEQNSDSALVDVQAVSSTNVWALGQSYYTKVTHPASCTPCTEVGSTFPIAIYEHWNGQRWSLAPTSSPRMMFEGSQSITVAPDGSAWAAGGCYWQDVVTHWNGHSWVPSRHPPDVTWPASWPTRDRHAPGPSCVGHS